MNPQTVEELTNQAGLKYSRQLEQHVKRILVCNIGKFDSQQIKKKKFLQQFDHENLLNCSYSCSINTLLLNYRQNLIVYAMSQKNQAIGSCVSRQYRSQASISIKQIVDTFNQRGKQKYYIPTLARDEFRMILYEYHWNYFLMKNPLQQTKIKSAAQKLSNTRILSIAEDEADMKREHKVFQRKHQDKEKNEVLLKKSQIKKGQMAIQSFLVKINVKDYQKHNFKFKLRHFESDVRIESQLESANKQLLKQKPRNQSQTLIKKVNLVQKQVGKEKYCEMYQKMFKKCNKNVYLNRIQLLKNQSKIKQQFLSNQDKGWFQYQIQKDFRSSAQPQVVIQKEKNHKSIFRKQSTTNSQIKFQEKLGSNVSENLRNYLGYVDNSIKISMIDSLVRQAQRQCTTVQPQIFLKDTLKVSKQYSLEKQRRKSGLLFKKLSINPKK